MQESNPQEAARFVLEHIQQSFLGEEVPITCAFNEYAVAKVERIGGRQDYVAAKWNFELYVPWIVFDPYCSKGTITKILCLYVYNKVSEPVKPTPPKKVEAYLKNLKNMSGEEMFFELEFIHGLSNEQVHSYKNMTVRKAKVVEMRALMNTKKNGK